MGIRLKVKGLKSPFPLLLFPASSDQYRLSTRSMGIVPIDAMGTQKNIAQHTCQAGADYILALKGNQGKYFRVN